jgi:signal transduction histidine kinase
MTTNKNISLEIKEIFDTNTLDDLNMFLNKRKCLNNTNTYLIYLFYLIQSAGILTTSIATGSNNINMIWLGVGLNLLATLINTYEKINNSMLKKILNDIKEIKNGDYVDEKEIIDMEEIEKVKDSQVVIPNNS